MKQLRNALKELESVPVLELMTDRITVVDGKNVSVHRPVDVRRAIPSTVKPWGSISMTGTGSFTGWGRRST